MSSILLLTLGTRGDVQPYFALAINLRQAGHAVTLATAERYAEFVRSYGITCAPFAAPMLDMIDQAEGAQVIAGKNKLAMLGMVRKILPMMRRMMDEIWQVCDQVRPDLILYHPKIWMGTDLAEKLGVPAILTALQPCYTPTREFANPLLTARSLGPRLNLASYRLFNQLATAPYRGITNTWRMQTLGLAKRGDPPAPPTIYAFSRHVQAKPADWADDQYISGYWFVPPNDDYAPPAELAQFLADGPPPIYIGFGSMPLPNADKTHAMVIEALQRAKMRGILGQRVPDAVSQPAPHVLYLKTCPQDWLFQRVAAAVHHGGAGTTAAAFQAGIPMLVCPFFGDQPYWAQRAVQLGVAPSVLPFKQISVEALTQAFVVLSSQPKYTARAQSLAQHIRAENGVATAAQIIASYLPR
ncbi:MAG: glycosyltransferase [Anaerolineae bacterium]|nr:glycosyltransferase [Anaerolineae bacterium]